MKAAPYTLINGFLYRLGVDDILRRCVLDHEKVDIMEEAHSGSAGGHFQADHKRVRSQMRHLSAHGPTTEAEPYAPHSDQSESNVRDMGDRLRGSVFHTWSKNQGLLYHYFGQVHD